MATNIAAAVSLRKKVVPPWMRPSLPSMAELPKIPRRIMPVKPPIPWTPQTSRASSQPFLFL